jgi:group I intron endonuclease
MRCIYAIINNITGNQYIGSSKNSYVRKKTHFNLLRRGAHHSIVLQRAFDKHGEDKFKFVVVEEVDANIDLIEREQWWLDNANCSYNITKQALPGKNRILTEETRAKMRAAKLGVKHPEWRNKQKSINQKGKGVGKKRSEEAKKAMSEAQKRLYVNGYQNPRKGMRHTPETIEKIRSNVNKTPVKQYDLRGNFIKEWPSVIDASRSLGKYYNCIAKCLKGEHTQSYGYIWKYSSKET